MATFEMLNDPRQYMAAMREIDKARDCGYAIDIVKHREVATNKQMAYLNFIISYYGYKQGETFYSVLRTIQQDVCPHIFLTEEGKKPKALCYLTTAEMSSVIRNFLDYASMSEVIIPDKDDERGMRSAKAELASGGAGWV